MKVKLYDTKKNYMTLKKIIGHEKLYELISYINHTTLNRCITNCNVLNVLSGLMITFSTFVLDASMDRDLMSLKTNLERCLVIIFFAFVLRLHL